MLAAPSLSAPVNLADLARLPRDGWRYDLLRGGRLIAMPPATPESSRITMRLSLAVARFIEDQGLPLTAFAADAGFQLDPQAEPPVVVSPDFSLVRNDRLPPLGTTGFWPLVPDLAVEVVSPSDSYSDVHAKVGAYLDAKTPLIQIIDPASRRAEVYRPGLPVIFLDADRDDVLDGGPLLPGLALRLADLLAR